MNESYTDRVMTAIVDALNGILDAQDTEDTDKVFAEYAKKLEPYHLSNEDAEVLLTIANKAAETGEQLGRAATVMAQKVSADQEAVVEYMIKVAINSIANHEKRTILDRLGQKKVYGILLLEHVIRQFATVCPETIH